MPALEVIVISVRPYITHLKLSIRQLISIVYLTVLILIESVIDEFRLYQI